MQVVNPEYAHDSGVGSVFDIATWRRPSWHSPGFLIALVLGLACAAAAVFVMMPDILGAAAPAWVDGLRVEIQKGHVDYPWAMRGGALAGMLVAYVFLAVCIADVPMMSQDDCFLRVGPGGMSLRLTDGLDKCRPWYKFIEFDVPWREVEHWQIVQRKELGSLGPNAGNLDADLNIRLSNGDKHCIPLGQFREPARIIHSKFQDALEMAPMQYVSENEKAAERKQRAKQERPRMEERTMRVTGYRALDDVEGSLRRLLSCGKAFVIFTDTSTGKFVQCCEVEGSLFLDLPAATLSDIEAERAAGYFERIGIGVETTDAPAADASVATAAKTGFIANLGTDVPMASQLVMGIFQEAYRVSIGFEMEIEETAAYSN